MDSSGTSSVAIKEKPVVVRVKRNSSQASLDAFWLEINERPLKKPFLGFESLSISDHQSKEILKTKRLLVQHVETVRPFEDIEDVLQSLLPNSDCSEDFMRKIEVRKSHFKQYKKQQLRSVAIQEHEELVRSARYEQIWKSRRGETDSLSEFCHLYDVVRVDTEVEMSIKKKGMQQYISAEDNAILSNYIPLLREYMPAAAEEMESEIKAYRSSEGSCSDSMASATIEDDYVYDLYTVEEKFTENEEDMICDYPLVRVEEDDQDFNDMPDSEYDSEDSNGELHPRNDYPDEESSDAEEDELDPFGDLECPNSEFEEEPVGNTSDEEASNNGDKGVGSECLDSENEGYEGVSSECSDSENEGYY